MFVSGKEDSASNYWRGFYQLQSIGDTVEDWTLPLMDMLIAPKRMGIFIKNFLTFPEY